MSLRAGIGLLYMPTGLVALYFSVQLTMTGLYGVPFSWWHVEAFFASLILIVGAICWWSSTRQWVGWAPLVGSVLLVAYFIPAGISLIRQFTTGHGPDPAEFAGRLGAVIIVLASLAVSSSNRPQPLTR
jgi:hypothetical protein